MTEYATFDPATVTSVTLSGGNLVATNTGTTSANQGAHTLASTGKTAGKYYFEVTLTTVQATPGGNVGFGIGTTASSYTNIGNSATTGSICYISTGNIWSNGSNSFKSLSARSQADVVAVAVDLGNLKIWYKTVSGTPGNWNGTVGADPATNTSGIAIASGTTVPFVVFGGTSGKTGNAFTENFGASAFTGSVPSGFISGWPAGLVVADPGSYALTGTSASVRPGRLVAAGAGSYVLTGTTASLLHKLRLAAGSGSYSLTGADASITVVTAKTLAADSGAYALTGTSASVRHGYLIGADPGSYALTGSAATLKRSYIVAAAASSYAIVGSSANLAHGYAVAASSGVYSLTGTDAALLRSVLLAAGAGAYAVSGRTARLIKPTPTNDDRIVTIAAEARSLMIAPEVRSLLIAAE